jgi:hypothetical protein
MPGWCSGSRGERPVANPGQTTAPLSRVTFRAAQERPGEEGAESDAKSDGEAEVEGWADAVGRSRGRARRRVTRAVCTVRPVDERVWLKGTGADATACALSAKVTVSRSSKEAEEAAPRTSRRSTRSVRMLMRPPGNSTAWSAGEAVQQEMARTQSIQSIQGRAMLEVAGLAQSMCEASEQERALGRADGCRQSGLQSSSHSPV